MPFPFVLPTTSSFSFSSSINSSSHPSLPLSTSTYRGVVRDALKKHKRLPPSSQISNTATVISSINGYIPYLLAVDNGLSSGNLPVGGDTVSLDLITSPVIEWRPTLSADVVPGRERARVKIHSFQHETFFVLSTLAFCYVLTSRSSLQPLYVTSGDHLTPQQRTSAITTASKNLVEAASIWLYLAGRPEQPGSSPPCIDVTPATARALSSLAHAEATLLAVLKDDPYPAAVAQDRNKDDREWMFKSPDIPKVRAHLFARLSLAASEHAAKAASLCHAGGSNKISPSLANYIEDLRRTSRAKACRFFGIDAELGGNTAEGIGWLRAGLQELGVEVKDPKKGLSFSRFKKDFTEKREDRRVEKETAWGVDAGRLEETRVLEMLDTKWNKINDTVGFLQHHSNDPVTDFHQMNTQVIPPVNSLLSKMPSGRDMYTIKPYEPPTVDRNALEAMRAPPDRSDDLGDGVSSDEDRGVPSAPGAYPGAADDYGRSPSVGGSTYY